jgi:hypothetical protein
MTDPLSRETAELLEHEPFEGVDQLRAVLRRLADELDRGPEPIPDPASITLEEGALAFILADPLTPCAKVLPSHELAQHLRAYADRLQAESA